MTIKSRRLLLEYQRYIEKKTQETAAVNVLAPEVIRQFLQVLHNWLYLIICSSYVNVLGARSGWNYWLGIMDGPRAGTQDNVRENLGSGLWEEYLKSDSIVSAVRVQSKIFRFRWVSYHGALLCETRCAVSVWYRYWCVVLCLIASSWINKASILLASRLNIYVSLKRSYYRCYGNE